MLLMILTASTHAAAFDWKEAKDGALGAQDDRYAYGAELSKGQIGSEIFSLNRVTNDPKSSIYSAFCDKFLNNGKMGDTLVIEYVKYNDSVSSTAFKYKQVRESIDKATPSDLGFAARYACLAPDAEDKAIRHTLYVPNGGTVQGFYPFENLKVTFSAGSDGVVTAKFTY